MPVDRVMSTVSSASFTAWSRSSCSLPGMPIAFALGSPRSGSWRSSCRPANLWSVAETMYAELDNFTLLTIPLFV